METVGPKLYRFLRKKRELSQTEFGQRLGKQRETISRWESGQTRPSYEDERRLFEVHGCCWQEALEILSEVVSEAVGRPVTIHFDARESEVPTHPLALAERRLRERGARLPEDVRQQLFQRILHARTSAAVAERTDVEILQLVNSCLEGKSHEQLDKIELSPFGLHWPDLDEDLSIRGILAGDYGQRRHRAA